MNTTMARLLWLPNVAAALLGLAVAALQPSPRPAFVGAVLVLLASSLFVSLRMLRPGPEGTEPSPGERDAWSAMFLCLAALVVLGLIADGGFDNAAASYIALFAYGGVALCMPALRKRRLAQQRWAQSPPHRGVIEDERDAAIQGLAARWSKHALEALVIVFAALYAAFVGEAGWPGGALPLIALLFGALFVANAVGELVAAIAYRRDRR